MLRPRPPAMSPTPRVFAAVLAASAGSMMRSAHVIILVLAYTGLGQSCPINCQICIGSSSICNLKYPATWTISSSTTEIPANSFQHGASLVHLNVSSVGLQILHTNSFVGLSNLLTFNLSHNQLTALPAGLFQPLTNLTTLDLRGNQLSNLTPDTFAGLSSLTTLYVTSNQLSNLSSELLSQLPSLTTIALKDNPWICTCEPSALNELVSGNTSVTVEEKDSVVCTLPNGIPVESFYQSNCSSTSAVPSTTATTSISTSSSISTLSLTSTIALMLTSSPALSSVSLTSTIYPATTTVFDTTSTPAPTPSPSLSTSPSPSPSPSLSLSQSPTPSPTPSSSPSCLPSSTESVAGTFQWPAGSLGEVAMLACPYGPSNVMAMRRCLQSTAQRVEWGPVEDANCSSASSTLQSLAGVDLDTIDVGRVTQMLAQLPFNHLTRSDLQQFSETISALTQSSAASDEKVIERVLSTVDTALQANTSSYLTEDSRAANMLQSAISTALLRAVNSNNSELTLQYMHLLAGGRLVGGGGGGEEGGGGGGEGEGEEVIAMVDKRGLQFSSNSSNTTKLIIRYHSYTPQPQQVVQVTVYNNSRLFANRICKNKGEREICEGGAVLLVPVTVVTTSGDGGGRVNITYESVMVSNGSQAECVVWNTSSNGGKGGWVAMVCVTLIQENKVICECSSTGVPVTVIEAPRNITNMTAAPSPLFPFLYRVVFYTCCGLAALLHLPILLAAIVVCSRHQYARSVQALVSHSLSQGLFFLLMMLSLERWELDGLCFTAGLLVHYAILVCFLWLTVRPVILVLRETQRRLYEKTCFIMPLTLVAWATPTIPVLIYAIVTVANGLYQLDLCWLESGVFPNYFTYVAVFSVAMATIVIIVCLFILAFSGFTVSLHSYTQLGSILMEVLLFSIVVSMQFVTATVPDGKGILLVITGGVTLLTAIYFFITNGLARPRMRHVLICRSDGKQQPVIRDIKQPKSGSTSDTSRISDRSQYRRNVIRHNDEMNLDYIGNYIVGYPLNMYQKVQQDKRIKGKKGGGIFQQLTRATSSDV